MDALVEDVRDRPLVTATREGDPQAFAVLYRRYVPLVRSILRDYALGPEELADLVQEVFTRALAGLGSLRDPDRFRPWLQAIARHVGRDARSARRPAAPADALDDEPAAEAGPEDLALFVELADLVDHVAVDLSPRDALAVSLTCLGFGPKDVAAALGITYSAAKVALHRARKRLRAAILIRLMIRDRPDCTTFSALQERARPGMLIQHVDECATCTATLETLVR